MLSTFRRKGYNQYFYRVIHQINDSSSYGNIRPALKVIACIFITLLFNLQTAQAQPLTINDQQAIYNLAPHLSWLVDGTESLTINQVMQSNILSQFKRNTEQIVDKRYSSKPIWFYSTIIRQNVRNDDRSDNITRLLDIAAPQLDQLDIYIKRSDGTITHQFMGDTQAFDNRNFKTSNFVSSINFLPNETIDIFIRVKSTSKISFPITLSSTEYAYSSNMQKSTYFGVFFGIMLLLIIYGAINYIPTKNISYLYFSFYTLFFTLLLASINGYTFKFIWPNLPILNQYAPVTFVFLVTILSIQLTTSLFYLKHKSPITTRFLLFLKIINTLVFIEFILLSHNIDRIMITHAASVLIIIAISSQQIKKNHLYSLTFFLAWISMLPGTIFYFTQSINIGFTITLSPKIILISHIIQMVFLANSLYLFDLRQRRLDRLLLKDSTKSLQSTNSELNTALAQLENNNLIKDRFLSTISHELRTPMNGVEGSLELIKTSNLTDEQKNYLQTAQISAQEMTTLIGSILRFSEMGDGKIETVEESFEIRSALSELSTQLRKKCQNKGLKDQWFIAKNVPLSIDSDKDKILLILQQLIDNAIKFTDKGSIKIGVEFYHDSATNNQQLQFSVSDTGAGIANKKLDLIFNAFKKIDSNNKKHQGLGIGLSICQQLASLMNGEITVTSRLNQGSTFILSLPIKVSEELTPAAAKTSFNHSLATLNAVLVVEDNPINQLILKSMLEEIGYMVLTADNGEQALKILDQQPIKLIMMDCQMPLMDGYETTKKIRSSNKAYSNIPIVAVTANAMSDDNVRCISAGMNDYIKKPIKLVVVKQKVERWIQSENIMSDVT